MLCWLACNLASDPSQIGPMPEGASLSRGKEDRKSGPKTLRLELVGLLVELVARHDYFFGPSHLFMC